MKSLRIRSWGLCLILISFQTLRAEAARHEIGLTLGGLVGQTRESGTTTFNLSAGTGLQANYGYRIFGGNAVALYGEVHFLANPMRTVSSANPGLSRNVATIFLTPGVRLKFAPKRNISPYVAAGGGWSVFEQSTMTLAGQPNPAPRTVYRGAFDYGAGVDVRLWRFISLRAEVRDFYSGNPEYNVPLNGRQHNVVAGGGFVVNFGK